MSDPGRIRQILNRDRAWSVYALGDLDPGRFERCEWTLHGDSLALLYRAFETPVLFAAGETGPWLLDAIGHEPRVYLHLLPQAASILEGAYQVRRQAMWRMKLDRKAWHPAAADRVERLGPGDAEAIDRLYRDGEALHESPDFYDPSMINEGVFFGVRSQDGDLVSAAGTHLVSEPERVAAIGNVYTRRDHRGRGLGAGATSAVVRELIARGIETIALNVTQSNTAACRVYERLGFVKYRAYYEGIAQK